MPPETLIGNSTFESMHLYIILWHNLLCPNLSLKKFHASASGTGIFSGMDRLLLLMAIYPSVRTFIIYTSNMTPFLSILFTISCDLCNYNASITNNYSSNTENFSLGPSWVNLQHLLTAWNSTPGKFGDKNNEILQTLTHAIPIHTKDLQFGEPNDNDGIYTLIPDGF